MNENIKILFTGAINTLNSRLKNYSRKDAANVDYIKNQDQLIQDLFNYYESAENEIRDLNFNKKADNVFFFSDGSPDIRSLKTENKRLKKVLESYGLNEFSSSFSPRARKFPNPYGY